MFSPTDQAPAGAAALPAQTKLVDQPIPAPDAAHEALMQFLYQAPIGLVQTTLDGEITMINPMSAQLLMPLALQGNLVNLFDVLQGPAPQLRALAAAASYPGGPVCNGLRLHLGLPAPGNTPPTTLSLQMLRLDAQTLMCSLSDITDSVSLEQQRVAAKLRDASRVDSLTGLPNRTVALERIEHAIERARSDPGYRYIVLFINGDRFNRVNVTLGSVAGDQLLCLMGERIQRTVRRSDALDLQADVGHSAARLGVDEFVVVVDAVPGPGCDREHGWSERGALGTMADVVASRLVDALGKPYQIGTANVHSTASVGIVLGDSSASDAEAVLQDACLAMREAKRSGGARHCLFEPQFKERARGRACVESELRLPLQEAQQAELLQALQCDKGQGDLYARPLGAEDATRWLAGSAATPGQRATVCTLQRAQAAERLLQQMEQSHFPVALFNPQEHLVWSNRSYRDVYWRHEGGAPTWEDIMRSAHRRSEGVLIETADIDGWIANVRKRYRQQPQRVFESDLTDGRWMRVSEETTADGWQLCVCSDLTSLKVNEFELRKAHDAALTASITDPLTGLPNRRHVFARLAAMMEQATELRLPLTVAVIDLDKFKLINDVHGHAMGDSVLVAFAQRLGASLRPQDVLGRIGGEEFLLVLMNTDRPGAERVLGDARRALRNGTLVPQMPELRANFSAGATVAHAGDSSDSLWQRADRGLYTAKATGRGCDFFVEAPDAAADHVLRLRKPQD